jgi:hypothetical protein
MESRISIVHGVIIPDDEAMPDNPLVSIGTSPGYLQADYIVTSPEKESVCVQRSRQSLKRPSGITAVSGTPVINRAENQS